MFFRVSPFPSIKSHYLPSRHLPNKSKTEEDIFRKLTDEIWIP